MIPTYLKSLAATVRDLVASGKAMHVTNKTAAELDLLAGLPWGSLVVGHLAGTDQPVRVTEKGEAAPMITPADLALGWLLASRAQPQENYIEGPNDVVRIERILDDGAKRAAECAELAALAPIASPAENLIKDFVASLGTGELPRALRRVYAHDGTREGARAAWGFVIKSLQHQLRLRVAELDAQTFRGQAPIPLDDSRVAICNRYRRELEAM